jgi:hypothetical protein
MATVSICCPAAVNAVVAIVQDQVCITPPLIMISLVLVIEVPADIDLILLLSVLCLVAGITQRNQILFDLRAPIFLMNNVVHVQTTVE